MSLQALATLLLIVSSPGLAANGGTEAAPASQQRELRGRAVCLDEALRPLDDELEAERCNEPGAARYGLRTEDGETVTFLPEDPVAEMFVDPRIRQRDLVVTGWPRPGGHFEILSVDSVIDGVRHHVHYRCDVCNITAQAPGPCWCCGQPFELREVPVDEGAGSAAGAARRDGHAGER